MKRLINLWITLAFFSCGKNELTINSDVKAPETKTYLNANLDVYSEDGVLVFKDWSVVDSVNNLLSTMTKEERLKWEKSMDFISALSYYEPIFDAFDRVGTKDEFIAFKQQFKSKIKMIDEGNDEISLDYPFNVSNFENILSKEGRFKIGEDLYINKADREIIILQSTPKLVENYQNATSLDEKESVIVIYFDNQIKTKVNDYYKTDWITDGLSSKRRYKWGVSIYLEFVKLSGEGQIPLYDRRLHCYFYQDCQKKKAIGGWNKYSTKYGVDYMRWNYRDREGYFMTLTMPGARTKNGKGGQRLEIGVFHSVVKYGEEKQPNKPEYGFEMTVQHWCSAMENPMVSNYSNSGSGADFYTVYEY